jgi:cobalt-zinc-cadmium efflux system membrane fusion protein
MTAFKHYKFSLLLFLAVVSFLACQQEEVPQQNQHTHEEASHSEVVRLSSRQVEMLQLQLDTLPLRNVSSYIETNGQLEVPPQNEASVTAIIGANISSIKVIEGDQVKKGDVLAYISHPKLIEIQSDYSRSWNELLYLEKEYRRQEKLHNEAVASAKNFQKIQAEYKAQKALVNGLEAQLTLLHIPINELKEGNIYQQTPILAPINGFVRMVAVKTGQFVLAESELFEIVNLEHIHADFMVFEKDIAKVASGQKIRFRTESVPGELEALVYSVGKNFEQDPKAVHIHAEIEEKKGTLLPGMYVRGKILVNELLSYALPEEAIVREGNRYYIFSARSKDGLEDTWQFMPLEVIPGTNSDGWTEIELKGRLAKGDKVVWNNAYYLMAEMKKEEAEHSH